MLCCDTWRPWDTAGESAGSIERPLILEPPIPPCILKGVASTAPPCNILRGMGRYCLDPASDPSDTPILLACCSAVPAPCPLSTSSLLNPVRCTLPGSDLAHSCLSITPNLPPFPKDTAVGVPDADIEVLLTPVAINESLPIRGVRMVARGQSDSPLPRGCICTSRQPCTD